MGKGNDSAYPVQWHMDGQLVAVPGLTKREYFAGLALSGMLANPGRLPTGVKATPKEVVEGTSEAAVYFADALLTALERSHDGG